MAIDLHHRLSSNTDIHCRLVNQSIQYSEAVFINKCRTPSASCQKPSLNMGVKEETPTESNLYIELSKLPSFSKLQKRVFDIKRQSSWWEKYGVEWFHVSFAVLVIAAGIHLLCFNNWLLHVPALFVIGLAYGLLANKVSHLAVHDGMCESPLLNKIIANITSEFIGSFSYWMGVDIHIKVHHPHTNVIGLGDSSTWKAPFLPSGVYMILSPLLIPLLSVPVSVVSLIAEKQIFALVKFAILGSAGLAFNFYLLCSVCGLGFSQALLYTWIYRAVLAIPYLHVNIFQHIGLELHMWSQDKRPPTRLVQMAHGCLNLPRNIILDYTFGHSLISCHVEHHLFPRLSDNMCLKIKPLVKEFLKENGLPYHERSYMDRFWHFMKNYESLMVKAPPITHFVGIQ